MPGTRSSQILPLKGGGSKRARYPIEKAGDVRSNSSLGWLTADKHPVNFPTGEV
jgi:hypothetical protein